LIPDPVVEEFEHEKANINAKGVGGLKMKIAPLLKLALSVSMPFNC
jgi:hypothetical protein